MGALVFLTWAAASSVATITICYKIAKRRRSLEDERREHEGNMSCLGPMGSIRFRQWVFALFILILVFSNPLIASDTDSVQSALDQGDQIIEDDPLQAAIHYETAVRLARSLDDPILIADSSAKLGQAAFLIGDHYSALKYLRLAFELYQKNDAKDQAAAQLSAIGSTYYFSKVGDLEQAKAYYDDAIEWYQMHNMESEVA